LEKSEPPEGASIESHPVAECRGFVTPLIAIRVRNIFALPICGVVWCGVLRVSWKRLYGGGHNERPYKARATLAAVVAICPVTRVTSPKY